MRFDLLAEMERDGFSSSRTSSSRNGQINGNCIFGCGGLGEDRLRVQPNYGENGWFICEHCNTKGTSIDYLMIKRGYTKHQALAEVGWKPKDGSEPKLLVPKRMSEVFPTHNPPSKSWQGSARAFAQYCEGILWGDLGQTALAYLRARGLRDETIKTARLGYNPVEMRQTASKWGREQHSKLWQGIVIPWLIGEDLWRITVRDEKAVDKSERYRQVAGSSNGLYLADSLTYHRPVILVEGEFSALSVAQECGQHVAVCATGSTGGAHTDQWMTLLAAQELLLVAFDAEESGDLASKWWLDLQNAQRLRPFWNDPNQMLQDGVDLWVNWISPRLQSIQASKETMQSEALTDGYEKCFCCHRLFPSFEGWEPDKIPVDATTAAWDPEDGEMYCEQCRPELFNAKAHVQSICVDRNLLSTAEQVLELAERIESGCTYVLDLETTGLNPRKDNIITIALGTPEQVWVIDVRKANTCHAQWCEALQKLLQRDGVLWAGHNLKFDWSFLAVHFGVRLRKVYDTMLVEKLIHNGMNGIKYALLATSARYGIEVSKEERNWFIGLDQRPREWDAPLPDAQIAYIVQDIKVPHQVIEKQQEAIEHLALQRVIELENNALPAIAAMEVKGIVVDTTRWEGILTAKKDRKTLLEARLKEVLGAALTSQEEVQQNVLFGEKSLPAINLASSDHLKKALGALGVVVAGASKDVLEEVKDAHPVVQELLDWKELEKFVTSFGVSVLKRVEEDDRIHATFDPLGAVSGRIICRDPNLQQIPKSQKKEEDLRSCFVAPINHKLLVADLSNIELRILAEMSEDPMMLRFFEEGKDLHAETARLMFKLGPDVDTKKHLINGIKARDIAKTINFGIAYGMGPGSLGARVGVDMETAKRLLNAYRGTYKRVVQYLDQTSRKSIEQKYVLSLSGRRRSFSEAALTDKKQRGESERAARNHPIQGTNADILKCALALLSERLPEGVHVVLTVHDEIVLESPIARVEVAERVLKGAMVDACREFLHHVVIPEPDVLIADYWIKG